MKRITDLIRDNYLSAADVADICTALAARVVKQVEAGNSAEALRGCVSHLDDAHDVARYDVPEPASEFDTDPASGWADYRNERAAA